MAYLGLQKKNMPSSVESYKPEKYFFYIAILGALFFIFGFVTWLNGTLIPYLRIACELNNFESFFVAFCFYISYFIMAIPSSWVLKKTGFKNGMMIGLFVMATGMLIFIPAAKMREYGIFLAGLFIIGTGLSLLQTASNPYITIIGPIKSAAQRISIMGICNKVAGFLSPLILGSIILKDADKISEQIKTMDASQKNSLLNSMAERVIVPYFIMALILIALGLLIRLAHLPEVEPVTEKMDDEKEKNIRTSIFQFPYLLNGVVALFLYVGVEVLSGDSIISYGKSLGIPLETARFFTSCTLFAMVIGYIFGIILTPKFISQQKALAVCAVLGVLLSLSALFTSGYFSVASIALLGFANAIMWPAIWPLAIERLGRFTKMGSALLIMAIAGGALLPLLYGRLADTFSPQQGYWILIPSYLFIYYFARWGNKMGKSHAA
jgi:MFS transporter, FHS family, L-fucose permease